jgi:hypothetical protein
MAVLVLLMATPAYAGWNLRQNDDGTTSWVRDDSAGVQRTHVAVPVTGYRIKRVSSVLYGAIGTADAVFSIAILSTVGTKLKDVTNGTGSHTITQSGSASGDIDSFTPTNATANYVEQDQSIRIDTVGAASNDVDAMFTIQLVPR